ncbi:MAG: hypothetical protein CM1200mP33_1040 [Chloroflexota bacterium]|nr:MAG: hypothetical protein CM1200mP33_1040 [Chloroflexota bacterium]
MLYLLPGNGEDIKKFRIGSILGIGKLLFGISLLWVWFFISSLMVLWYGKKPNERDVLQILMFGKYLPVFLGTIFFVFMFHLQY